MAGTSAYRFRYELHGLQWRAYIEAQPPYGTRSANGHATHRYRSPDGRYWVCWTPEPTRLDDCKKIARYWAKCHQNYLRTGSFREPLGPRTAGQRTAPEVTWDPRHRAWIYWDAPNGRWLRYRPATRTWRVL